MGIAGLQWNSSGEWPAAVTLTLAVSRLNEEDFTKDSYETACVNIRCKVVNNGRLLRPWQRDNGNYAPRRTHYATRGLQYAARGSQRVA